MDDGSRQKTAIKSPDLIIDVILLLFLCHLFPPHFHLSHLHTWHTSIVPEGEEDVWLRECVRGGSTSQGEGGRGGGVKEKNQKRKMQDEETPKSSHTFSSFYQHHQLRQHRSMSSPSSLSFASLLSAVELELKKQRITNPMAIRNICDLPPLSSSSSSSSSSYCSVNNSFTTTKKTMLPPEKFQELTGQFLQQLMSRNQGVLTPPNKPYSLSHNEGGGEEEEVEFFTTTVQCWHGVVAQKSYGCEKRFLCPPPMLQLYQKTYSPLSSSSSSLLPPPPPAVAAANSPATNKEIVGPQPIFSLSITGVSSAGANNANDRNEQQIRLNEEGWGQFKYLHVNALPLGSGGGGGDKVKQFSLNLKMLYTNITSSKDTSSPSNTNRDEAISCWPFAAWNSKPIGIISKPSKKTALSRNTQTCIKEDELICLFNRIHSQTVSTRYLGTCQRQLCALQQKWTPFKVHILTKSEMDILAGTIDPPLRGAKPPPLGRMDFVLRFSEDGGEEEEEDGEEDELEVHKLGVVIQRLKERKANPYYTPNILHYGATVILEDVESGLYSLPLVLRKVERHVVISPFLSSRATISSIHGDGPVSQMQKVALEKWRSRSTLPSFLCATPEPIPLNIFGAGAATSTSIGVGSGGEGKKRRTPSPSSNHQSAKTTTGLTMSNIKRPRISHLYSSPADLATSSDQETVAEGPIDDHLCWTIIGVKSFKQTFHQIWYPTKRVMAPLTPAPFFTNVPTYNPFNGTLVLDLNEFPQQKEDGEQESYYSLWIGTKGPWPFKKYPQADKVRLVMERVWEAGGKAVRKASPWWLIHVALVRIDGVIVPVRQEETGEGEEFWVRCRESWM